LDLPPVEDERMNELIDKKTKSKIGILRNKGKIEDESKETEVKRQRNLKFKILLKRKRNLENLFNQ